jgi:hypothetical protein
MVKKRGPSIAHATDVLHSSSTQPKAAPVKEDFPTTQRPLKDSCLIIQFPTTHEQPISGLFIIQFFGFLIIGSDFGILSIDF